MKYEYADEVKKGTCVGCIFDRENVKAGCCRDRCREGMVIVNVFDGPE